MTEEFGADPMLDSHEACEVCDERHPVDDCPEMQRGPCVVCGHAPACGYASIFHDNRRDWYCHGDCPHEEDSGVSCYERRTPRVLPSAALNGRKDLS